MPKIEYKCRNLNPESPGDCMIDPDEQATFAEIYHEKHGMLGWNLQYIRCKVFEDPTFQLACSGNPKSPKPIIVDSK